MEEFLKGLMFDYQEYAYIILLVWCFLEGEIALILAGVMCHMGLMHIALAIPVAGLGAFIGDQFYFYLGRYNKQFILNKLKKQKRKFAIAHLMLKQYGSIIIFIQRYMYGFRIIIPVSIGITRYDSKKYAMINAISSVLWAAITIVPAWYFGEEIWQFVGWAEEHWYYAVPIILGAVGLFFYGLKRFERSILNERKERKSENRNFRSKFRRDKS